MDLHTILLVTNLILTVVVAPIVAAVSHCVERINSSECCGGRIRLNDEQSALLGQQKKLTETPR
jgi:uncharacterized membrane protein